MLRQQQTWLVTGCAGFIGSHLIETLLKLNQRVVGMDNFATGHRKNLNLVRKAVGEKAWKRFHFVRGDIRKLKDCYKAFGLKMPKVGSGQMAVGEGLKINANRPRHTAHPVDIVLHQAALGSVPRSIKDPLSTHEVNVTGFVNMLIATRDAGVRRFVYASSSSVYGDSPVLPKREDRIGRQLSPYAVSKYANELYAGVFGRCYGLETIGLRYFNVFGPRQDPNGPYAAVIPRWIAAIRRREPVHIYGDGKTSRDFCYIENTVEANLLSGSTVNKKAFNQVYNVACGNYTSLKDLHRIIQMADKKRSSMDRPTRHKKAARINCTPSHPSPAGDTSVPPVFLPARIGDIRHSLADIKKIKSLIKYNAPINLKKGLSMLYLN
jgi:UDP-N-acetylglucosamine/UDP-N-acetylgalactosamine 4-epimerase